MSLELHMSHFYMQYELGTFHVYMFVYVRVRVCECVYVYVMYVCVYMRIKHQTLHTIARVFLFKKQGRPFDSFVFVTIFFGGGGGGDMHTCMLIRAVQGSILKILIGSGI